MNWIKYLALCLPLTVVLVGCAPKEATKTESTESVEMSNPPVETTEDKAETKTDEVKTDEAAKPMDKAAEGGATTDVTKTTETKTETKKTQ